MAEGRKTSSGRAERNRLHTNNNNIHWPRSFGRFPLLIIIIIIIVRAEFRGFWGGVSSDFIPIPKHVAEE